MQFPHFWSINYRSKVLAAAFIPRTKDTTFPTSLNLAIVSHLSP
ncbi:unnamed protein product [Penicillium camemberti]|uniref:Str. FM013 n=1 Tax=Penicillium camemberti (strain FM 013) TaxID=1429867 RepID=A0A0G4P0E2_PENC3|nr:unnamed protein product [Penicillium camemberti]